MDAHRARRRRPVPVEFVPERAGASTVDPADEEPELWEAVRDLPPKQRTAVFCRTVLGMPYEEVARLLESSQDAARRNVFEGLRTLREGWTP
jgi:DNA-directed RNA polymerase specialized sigma24 family protein